MTAQEARKLGQQIVKQSNGLRVKFGETNGRPCLHLIFGKKSQTIFTESEWNDHPENKNNQKKSRETAEWATALTGGSTA